MKYLRLWTLDDDGTPSPDATLPFYPLDENAGRPFKPEDGVAIHLRPITTEHYQAVVKKHTSYKPKVNAKPGDPLEEVVDFAGVNDELLRYAIVRWDGIVSRNRVPLPCTPQTKVAFTPTMRAALISRAMQTEVSEEVTAATFRQPADVPAVVGGLGRESDLLPAGQA